MVLFLQVLKEKKITNVASPHACYMPCPYYPHWLHRSNNNWRKVQFMELFIIRVSSAPNYLILFRSKYSIQHLFANILSLCSSLNVKDHRQSLRFRQQPRKLFSTERLQALSQFNLLLIQCTISQHCVNFRHDLSSANGSLWPWKYGVGVILNCVTFIMSGIILLWLDLNVYFLS